MSELADAQGSHAQAACRWYREVTLPVPVQKAGRLVVLSPETAVGAARETGRAGRYARVSWHGLGGGSRAAGGAGGGRGRARDERITSGGTQAAVGTRWRPWRGRAPGADGRRVGGAALAVRRRRLVVPGGAGVTAAWWVTWQRC